MTMLMHQIRSSLSLMGRLFIMTAALVLSLALVNGARADYPPLNEWQEYPGTIPNDAKDNSAAACALWAWTSALYDSDADRLFLVRNGGHLDQCKGQSLMLDIMGALNGTAAWVRVEPVQTFTGPGVIPYSTPTDTGCFAPLNGPPDQHHYDAGLVWLGGNRGFHGGNPGGGSAQCPTAAFFEIPANPTDPWTWTPVPAAVPYVGIGTSAVVGDNIYFIKRSGTSAVINKDTGALVTSDTTWRGVKINGVEQPKPSGSLTASAMSAGDVNNQGLYAFGTPSYLYVANTQGGVVGTNDDTWPRLLRRPVGANAPVGSPQALITAGAYNVTAWNDKFIIQLAGNGPQCRDLIVFDPDDSRFSTAGDTWTLLPNTNGPVACSTLPYQKGFVVSQADGREFLVYLPGDSKNMWAYGLTEPQAANLPPDAVDDAFSGDEDTQISGNVIANDTDDNGPLSATVTTIPPTGSLALNPDGSFTYDPVPDFFGEVTFTYTLSDGTLSDTATVTLTITDVPDNIGTPDFASRCAASQAFFCQPFDVLGPNETIFLNGGSGPNSVLPYLENGRMVMEQRSQSGGAAAGQWRLMFESLHHAILPGDEIWIQTRYRFNDVMIGTRFQATPSGFTTWKLGMLSSDNTSCTASHLVMIGATWSDIVAPDPAKRSPLLYGGCGAFENFRVKGTPSSNLDSQPLENRQPSVSRACWAGNRDNCVQFLANQWMTVTEHYVIAPSAHIDFGDNARWNVTAEGWIQYDGQAPQQFIGITRERGSMQLGWRSLWRTFYQTDKDATQVHDTGIGEVDEIIVSEHPIPFRPY
jgi:hypothetical protein